MFVKRYLVIILLWLPGCSKKESEGRLNHSPVVTLSAELIQANPFTFQFTANATDQDFDVLTYTWDFGEGTVKSGNPKETFSYGADKDYTVKVTVSDGKSKATENTLSINTRTTTVTIDASKKFQTMEGFGGFGSQKEYWAAGPFTSDEFVNSLINDLGLTILRDNVPTSFEIVNDNNDPFATDLTKYNLSTKVEGHDETLNDHLDHLKKMKAAGLQKFIACIWSPSPWMKYNNKVGNGTQNQNSAPGYTASHTSGTNQLKTDLYNEFAEYCVAYIKIINRFI